MIFKTLLFLFVMYFLVKVLSRLFMPATGPKQHNARVFYRMYKNIRDQQKEQQNEQVQNPSKKFDEIEEAEFEDVTEEDTSSA